MPIPGAAHWTCPAERTAEGLFAEDFEGFEPFQFEGFAFGSEFPEFGVQRRELVELAGVAGPGGHLGVDFVFLLLQLAQLTVDPVLGLAGIAFSASEGPEAAGAELPLAAVTGLPPPVIVEPAIAASRSSRYWSTPRGSARILPSPRSAIW